MAPHGLLRRVLLEQILNRLRHAPVTPSERERLLAILENLVRFIVVQSREWLTSPNEGVPFPAITCLPQGKGEVPVCRLSKRDWEAKKLLGFGDYVPDTDTTFVGLAVAQRWLDLVAEQGLSVDSALVDECEFFLAHPWVGVIHEFQFGSRYESNLPTIRISKPLDYYGAVPIWFDKPFPRPGGNAMREILGNETVPATTWTSSTPSSVIATAGGRSRARTSNSSTAYSSSTTAHT